MLSTPCMRELRWRAVRKAVQHADLHICSPALCCAPTMSHRPRCAAVGGEMQYADPRAIANVCLARVVNPIP